MFKLLSSFFLRNDAAVIIFFAITNNALYAHDNISVELIPCQNAG